mmetsp:Transcript_38990/g.98735  ORF Transcript_38990/g.98735 Transcript_38990/m.98735 type:complete len:299 (+) Transcript_38990:784-1680(+)
MDVLLQRLHHAQLVLGAVRAAASGGRQEVRGHGDLIRGRQLWCGQRSDALHKCGRRAGLLALCRHRRQHSPASLLRRALVGRRVAHQGGGAGAGRWERRCGRLRQRRHGGRLLPGALHPRQPRRAGGPARQEALRLPAGAGSADPFVRARLRPMAAVRHGAPRLAHAVLPRQVEIANYLPGPHHRAPRAVLLPVELLRQARQVPLQLRLVLLLLLLQLRLAGLQLRAVAQVGGYNRQAPPLCDARQHAQRARVPARQVVHYYYSIASGEQRQRSVRADEAGAAGHQYRALPGRGIQAA